MKNIQKGFTLIELMIVVAIIGILAAVAIPAYQDYIVKAKLSKVASTMDPIKLALAMYYQENGGFPAIASTVTTATSGNGLSTGDIWTSLGLSKLPTLPTEISQLATTGTTATSAALVLTLTNIKAGASSCVALSIDGCTLTMTGTAGATSIDWANTSTSTNTVMKKYYNF